MFLGLKQILTNFLNLIQNLWLNFFYYKLIKADKYTLIEIVINIYWNCKWKMSILPQKYGTFAFLRYSENLIQC